MYAEGATDAEVHGQFPAWAEGTFRNRRRGWKDQIDDLRRARTVQLWDIPGTRKAARVNDYWELRSTAKWLIQKHLESCYAADPVSGVLEFVEQLVDARKLKVYWDMVGKANRAIINLRS